TPSVPERGSIRAASESANRTYSRGNLHALNADDLRLFRDLLALSFEVFQAESDHVLDILDHFLISLTLGVARSQSGTLGHIISGLVLLDDDLEYMLCLRHIETSSF